MYYNGLVPSNVSWPPYSNWWSSSQKAYTYLINTDGVFDVVETNESQSEGKYFIIMDKNKWQQAKQTIDGILKVSIDQLRDIADNKANMLYKIFPSPRLWFSAGGYTSKPAEMYGDLFDETTPAISLSALPKFEMSFAIKPLTFLHWMAQRIHWSFPFGRFAMS